MRIKGIIDEDFVNFRLPSMFIITSKCTFKCERECGIKGLCQNSALVQAPEIEISIDKLIKRFEDNGITNAIVFGGLEPFDTSDDLQNFLLNFRYNHAEPVVIYTGYTEDEVKQNFNWIYLYENIIIKYGRFIPNQEEHFDEILGVKLKSPNQYARIYNEL
jgi:hypothetical protein